MSVHTLDAAARREIREGELAINPFRVQRNLKENGGFSLPELATIAKVLRAFVREFPLDLKFGELLRKLDEKRISEDELEQVESMLYFLTRP